MATQKAAKLDSSASKKDSFNTDSNLNGILAAAGALSDLNQALASDQSVLQSINGRLDGVQDSVRCVELQAPLPSFVWCIDDFCRSFCQARAGQQERLVSEPFQLGPYGYRMRMSACLFGDSAVRGRSLSVFICFLPGDFDSLLEWPFNRRVYITAMDLTGEGRHHSRVLMPGRGEAGSNRAYLRRPAGGQSPWFGLRNFMELAKLENGGRFVRSDRLHLRLEVPPDQPLWTNGNRLDN